MTSKDTEKPEEAKVDDDQHPAMGMFAYAVGGIVGLLILVGLAALLEGGDPPSRSIEELPHLAILVSIDDIRGVSSRQSLAELQRELVATGLAVVGPLNYPILIPAKTPQEEPAAKDFDKLTPEEWAEASPFFESGKWLTPRIYSPDMREVVIRVAPPGRKPFPSGSATKVQQVLEKYASHFSEILSYSRALGLEDPEARNRINLTFGVQSANVLVQAKDEGHLRTPEVVAQLKSAVDGVGNPAVRSKVSVGSYVTYVQAVRTRSMMARIDGAPIEAILKQAAEQNVPILLSGDGKLAWVEVYTEAEGKANSDLCYYLAANLNDMKGVSFKVMRKRAITVE